VEFALQGGANRREIARRYGISAPSLYKWMKRYRSQGIEGLQNNARRPLHSPKRTGAELENLILELRDKYPYWGGRKLRRRLEDLGHQGLPATSTITDILRRHGRLAGVVVGMRSSASGAALFHTDSRTRGSAVPTASGAACSHRFQDARKRIPIPADTLFLQSRFRSGSAARKFHERFGSRDFRARRVNWENTTDSRSLA
jgi:transposase-like protein